MGLHRACEGRSAGQRSLPRWSRGCRCASGLLSFLALLLAGVTAAPLEAELRIVSLRLAFPPAGSVGRPAGRLWLSADLPTQILPSGYRLETDGITVEVGGILAGAFLPLEAGVRLVRREDWFHELRARRAPGRAPGRLVLDRGHGHLELKASGLDLSALQAAGPAGVSVVVRMGETVFSARVDLTARGKRWTCEPAPAPFIPPPPGPAPPPATLTLRVLETGLYSAIHVGETAVARNWTEYGGLWARHYPPMPPGVGAPDIGPPNVDFSAEIVVAVFLGDQVNGETAEILGVTADGSGARVSWAEVRLGPNCPAPMYATIPSPYVLAALTRVEGPVVFERQIVVRNCP